MFGIKKKVKIVTPKEFGELVAGLLMESLFPNGVFRDEDIRQRFFNGVPQEIFLKEWLIFNASLFSLAFSTVFKEGQLGQSAHSSFIESIKAFLIKAVIFESHEECERLFSSRYATYDEELSANREPNYIYWISKRFCQFCGADTDLEAVIGHSAMYPIQLKADIELINNLLKKVRLALDR